jgi:very-short-patch-repair endonuclease
VTARDQPPSPTLPLSGGGRRQEPRAPSAGSTSAPRSIGPRGSAVPTSPCKGEVDREAVGRGSTSAERFSRTPGMTSCARRLRKNLTDAEKRLWRALRRDQLLGLNFRRQHPIGPYVLDFYCSALALAVEIDGGQHNYADKRLSDERRSRLLSNKGIRVVRFWNNEVLQNIEGVLSEIARFAEARHCNGTPSPALPLSGGGRRREPRKPSGGSPSATRSINPSGSASLTSPCKGEVDREAVGRGSPSSIHSSRSRQKTSPNTGLPE